MKTQYPAGIVVEIPEPIRSQIRSIREFLGTVTSKLPVEITVAGSSGLGYIPIATKLSIIISEIDRIFPEFIPFEVSFSEIRLFPNTFTFYLAPFDRKSFDSIHYALRMSSIPFTDSPFTYTPHCTLRDGKNLNHGEIDNIFSLSFPREPFLIDTVALYDLPFYDPIEGICDCNLLYKKTIKA